MPDSKALNDGDKDDIAIAVPASIDIAIVGGGLVGASLACAMSKLAAEFNLRIAVIEPALPTRGISPAQPSFDARSTALSFGSHRIYEWMGVWAELSHAVTAIKQIHVSDKGAFGNTLLTAQDQGLDALGYVVENAMLGRVLYERLNQIEQVALIAPAQVTQAVPCAAGYRLTVECDEASHTIEAALLVVADGGRSELCQKLNISRQIKEYEQYAVITNILTDKPHENIAYERFTQDGPVAILPLHDASTVVQNRSALVLTLDAGAAEPVRQMSDDEFISLVQARFGYRLGKIRRVGERFDYPLALQQADEQVRQGLVVLGNAAHTLHPVAGQGFNLALRGVERLVTVLQQSMAQERGPGDLKTLLEFRDQQSADQGSTIQFTDQLLGLFGNQDLLLGLIRDLGLVGLDLLPAAKRQFARQAMGLKSFNLN